MLTIIMKILSPCTILLTDFFIRYIHKKIDNNKILNAFHLEDINRE